MKKKNKEIHIWILIIGLIIIFMGLSYSIVTTYKQKHTLLDTIKVESDYSKKSRILTDEIDRLTEGKPGILHRLDNIEAKLGIVYGETK